MDEKNKYIAVVEQYDKQLVKMVNEKIKEVENAKAKAYLQQIRLSILMMEGSDEAAQALAPSSDDLTLLALAGVDDLVLEVGAERAFHDCTS